ncbi:hypothetical protein AB1Y20_021162 [Prymnesium parvum]|uniref:Uncharacterized protein n=1 Tax=Prymnesium parvum TaxID=97485 RepID=A0AB34JJC4_PRYPA
MASTLHALALVLLAAPAAETVRLTPPLHPSTYCRHRSRCNAPDARQRFDLRVDLGPGCGVMEQALEPLFSSSDLVTVRYQLPLRLELAPHLGQMRVTKSGMGLMEGDVLRACSTFQPQMDNVFGLFPVGTKPSKCLFICDGQPSEKVIEALTANTEDKASEILMVFERPSELHRLH